MHPRTPPQRRVPHSSAAVGRGWEWAAQTPLPVPRGTRPPRRPALACSSRARAAPGAGPAGRGLFLPAARARAAAGAAAAGPRRHPRPDLAVRPPGTQGGRLGGRAHGRQRRAGSGLARERRAARPSRAQPLHTRPRLPPAGGQWCPPRAGPAPRSRACAPSRRAAALARAGEPAKSPTLLPERCGRAGPDRAGPGPSASAVRSCPPPRPHRPAPHPHARAARTG